MRRRPGTYLLFFSAVILAMAGSLCAQTFSNTTSIAINDNAAATPYPSTIPVSGLTGTITDINVTLNNIIHNYPDDIGVLLVGPTGVKVRLMTDVGGGTGLTGVTITFDDAAASPVPDEGPIVAGSYKPTAGVINGLSNPHPANFPAPAPASPYSILLSDFNGTDPNGTWSLYVDDDTAVDGGTISGGWSLTITTAVPEPSTWMLLSSGLAGVMCVYWRRRRAGIHHSS